MQNERPPEILTSGLVDAPRALLDAMPIAVYTTDPDGRITYHNPAAEALWGGPPAPDARFSGAWALRTADGDPLDPSDSAMAETLRAGIAIRGREAIAVRPDGSAVPFLAYPAPLRDANGVLTGSINLLVEVTDRIDRERLAAIVSSSNDAILSKTLDGVITSWNDAATRIFGYTAQEMVGTHITAIIPPELHEEERGILARLRRGERIEHFDTIRLASDGRRIDVSLTVSPLRDASGTIVGASKVARDVTERKRNEQLQRRLFDELNHRVRNTLATIQALAGQSLRHATSPGSFVASFTGRVQALAGVHDLLVRRRLNGVDLAELVQDRLGDTDRVSLSGSAVEVPPAEAVQLALVLHELATNARQHGALSVDTGRLEVSWSRLTADGCRLRLFWRETGMTAAIAPNAPRFGVTLIKRFLDSAGGSAKIRYPAGGLTCEIDLPLPGRDDPPAAGETATGPGAMAATPRAGTRVLLVEDEALVALDIESHLLAAGYAVIGPAATLEAARSLIASTEFEAALLDANLAGRTVEDLAAALSERAIPFAFATGYGREALPRDFRDAPLLGKPFTDRQLLAMLDELLAN